MTGTIFWAGRPVPFRTGETVATALLRAGIAAFGQAPTGQARAVFCGIGLCQGCLIRADGRVEQLGQGGMPIGLLPNVVYERIDAQLDPGDRLFLVSDGVTECPDSQGNELGAEGLVKFLHENHQMDPPDLLEALVWMLNAHTGHGDFPDDVSGVLFARSQAPP